MPSDAAALVGTWKLVSAEDVDPKTGQWVAFIFGNPPCGDFLYDAAGHASIQPMTTPPTVLTTRDQPTPDEALEIFNGYIACFETDESDIYHHVDGALDPSQVGSVQTRPDEIDADTLIIGDQVTYKKTLTRVG